MAHRNIPIFIPHLGCPHQCVFCNQNAISGCQSFSEEDVPKQIDAALSTIPSGADVEIAFFGGSFTGIDRGLMIRLLNLAQGYVDGGRVQAIRLSTRPDFIDCEILKILSGYSVKTIELGLQSMDDAVLKASCRGHNALTAEHACRAVKSAGFQLVGQMMIGLPEADKNSEVYTAEKISLLGADAVRIYPTVVFSKTPLEAMWRQGKYQPLSVQEAVERSAAALRVFQGHGIPCLRVGLCASEELTSPESAVAGPNHPAIGELVRSEIYFENMKDRLKEEHLLGKQVKLLVPSKEVSLAVGQHRRNLQRLQEETNTRVLKLQEMPDLREFIILPADDEKRSVSPCI